jgi:CRISPR-associated endonuclease/helicase Cas3
MVWKDIHQVMLPGQIRELIEATYHDREETGLMARHLYRLNSEREKLHRFALLGLSQMERTQPEEKARTRYSEQETVEVLLIRNVRHEQKTTRVVFSDGEILIPWNARSLSPKRWREISATLREHTLNVPEYHAPMAVSRNEIEWLEDYFYLGKPEFDESLLLRVAFVDDDGRIKPLSGGNANASYALEYDSSIGYQAKKRGKDND